MENKHINKDTIAQYHNNQLSAEDTLKLLEHVADCTYCADIFATGFEEYNLVTAPRNLKQQVLWKVDAVTQEDRKKRLFFYNMRVCFAMCFALILLIGSMHHRPDNPPVPHRPVKEGPSFLENAAFTMNEFTYRINETMNDLVIEPQSSIFGGNDND